MHSNILKVIVVCVSALVMSCTVIVNKPKETRVKAENDLVDLSVDVAGNTTNVDGIDLVDVYVGDVYFPNVDYGTTTALKVTNRSGMVDVDIDEAVVYYKVLGLTMSLSFVNISTMTATIERDKDNTVVFDDNTAQNIFSALAKKKTP
jgi:uncharacterized protein (UPF0212 family)